MTVVVTHPPAGHQKPALPAPAACGSRGYSTEAKTPPSGAFAFLTGSMRSRFASEALRPFLRAVLNGDDHDLVIEHRVGNDVGRAWHDQFSGVLDAAKPSHVRHVGEISDGAKDSLIDAL